MSQRTQSHNIHFSIERKTTIVGYETHVFIKNKQKHSSEIQNKTISKFNTCNYMDLHKQNKRRNAQSIPSIQKKNRASGRAFISPHLHLATSSYLRQGGGKKHSNQAQQQWYMKSGIPMDHLGVDRVAAPPVGAGFATHPLHQSCIDPSLTQGICTT